MTKRKPAGYELVSDEDRATYNAVVARMAEAVVQERLAARAEWRKMGDKSGWCYIDGAPDNLLAVKRTTKTQIILAPEPKGYEREERYVLSTGKPYGRSRNYVIKVPSLIAKSLPPKVVARALDQIREGRNARWGDPAERTPWGRSLLALADKKDA